VEFDEDHILGKIIRIWEYANGEEYSLTLLRSGYSIETRKYRPTSGKRPWHWDYVGLPDGIRAPFT
jgi:hypothetical protein